MRRLLATTVAIAVPLLAAGHARAADTDQTDPNDVDGRLDLAEVRLAHDDQPFVWTFLTFATWTNKQIWDRGYFVVQLDTVGKPAMDYLVIVRSTGKKLRGELIRKRVDGTEVHLGRLRARRAGPSGAAVAVPATSLKFGSHRTMFRWWAASLFTSKRCPRTCIDTVPDGGPVEQALEDPEDPPEP